jgi:hypothetical protein
MAKLGSKKRPAIVRVQTEERAFEMLELCNEHGWQVIVGIEMDKPENITDIERLLKPEQKTLNLDRVPTTSPPK